MPCRKCKRAINSTTQVISDMAAVVEDEGEDFFSALVSIEEKSLIPESLARKLQDAWTTKVKEVKGLKVEREKQKLGAGKRRYSNTNFPSLMPGGFEWRENIFFFIYGQIMLHLSPGNK